ncbi:MAG: 3-hydroxyacyl-CoA dehydrogenase family protein [Syntrophales bacterium]
MTEIKKVAVIGAGTMGHGIAQVVAHAGIRVSLNDIKTEFLEQAHSSIKASLEKMKAKGKISGQVRTDILSRIQCTTEFRETACDADLVVEAVPENLDLKKETFRKLDELTGANCILSTNTSQYSVTEIASVVKDPSRVIGTHFFNPPVAMKLVEVIRGLSTSDDTLKTVRDFISMLGKETVVCRDSQGFISTRVLVALRLECYRLLEEGVASMEDIDKTLKLAFGHPMGQFELADFSGLDIEPPIFEGLAKIYGDRFRPPQNILHLVKSGSYGRKSGKGWYKYTK